MSRKEFQVRTLIQAFKTKELRNKILFVIAMIIIYRIGSFIPAPGVDYNKVQECVGRLNDSQENFVGLVNLFSGGAMLQLSIFALGVMPYITASIVIQLLRVVIPRFQELHKEGQSGEAKLTQYTRYLTIGLAILQSTTILVTARSGALFNYQCGQVIPDGSVWNLVLMVIVLTGGTGLIMWMAELITEKGIGQGMSILIFMSICSGFLPQLWQIGWGTNGKNGNWRSFGIVTAVLIVILIVVDYVELAQRRIPVQYTRRMVGRKMYGGSSTYLPLKINMSGVIPPIFASSILAIPTLVAQFGKSDQSWVKWINSNLANTTSWVYILLYSLMIVAFCFFYTSITFDPDETADNMKEYGGFIPGIRAGSATSRYLQYVMNRLNTVGSIYLLFVALIPTVLIMALKLNSKLPFGGTTILIIAGVGLDTLRQAKAQTEQFQYNGFLLENVDHKEGKDTKSEVKNHSNSEHTSSKPAADEKGTGRSKGLRLVIMGPQGVGKGTQAELLSKHYGIPHISTGDIFRENLKNDTELGREAKRYTDKGELVPDELTDRIVADRLAQADAKDGWILDGYPRNAEQVGALDGLLERDGETLSGVVALDADREVLMDRMSRRAQSEGRDDDTPEAIEVRLKTYEEQTAPLLGTYRDRGELLSFDGTGDIDEISQGIIEKLDAARQ